MTAERLLKALADQTRLRIAVLLSHGELCVCDLTEVLQLPQSTVSRHMAVMRASELVSDRRANRWVHYRVTESVLVNQLVTMLAANLGQDEPFVSDYRTLR